jgi:hypothetical protein
MKKIFSTFIYTRLSWLGTRRNLYALICSKLLPLDFRTFVLYNKFAFLRHTSMSGNHLIKPIITALNYQNQLLVPISLKSRWWLSSRACGATERRIESRVASSRLLIRSSSFRGTNKGRNQYYREKSIKVSRISYSENKHSGIHFKKYIRSSQKSAIFYSKLSKMPSARLGAKMPSARLGAKMPRVFLAVKMLTVFLEDTKCIPWRDVTRGYLKQSSIDRIGGRI